MDFYSSLCHTCLLSLSAPFDSLVGGNASIARHSAMVYATVRYAVTSRSWQISLQMPSSASMKHQCSLSSTLFFPFVNIGLTLDLYNRGLTINVGPYVGMSGGLSVDFGARVIRLTVLTGWIT